MRISDWSSDVCSSDLHASQEQRQHAPDERQWHASKHDRRVANASKRTIEQQHDQCKTGGNHQHQPLAGRLEVLELTTPPETLAGREAHLTVDRLPPNSNDTDNIPPTQLGITNHPPPTSPPT